jgi:hypothetical protein
MPLTYRIDRVDPVLNSPNSSAHLMPPHGGRVRLGVGELFVVISAALSVLGWLLALAGLLHRTGYAIGLIGVFAAVVILSRRCGLEVPTMRRRRWRRTLPLCFAAILILSFVGGAFHLPSNYDALSYRTPQLLHWFDAGMWHWIDTPNSRMNIAPPGYNWLAAPFLVFTGTDRWMYLPNVAAFALLPGYLFEMLWRAGVRKASSLVVDVAPA